ncbi:MAG: ABCB family ABC transporter ATP-binding protein/permease [Alphaproteobacteria bacterium]
MSTQYTLLEEHGEGAPSLRPLWSIFPYLWPKDRPDLRMRVVLSVVALVLGKIIIVVVPILNGMVIDTLKQDPLTIAIATAVALIIAYAVASAMASAFNEVRNSVFARVSYHAVRQVAVQTFVHLHALSLRFHLERRTGGLSRVIDRGVKGIDTLLTYGIFLIFPTVLEFTLVCIVLFWKFDIWFVAANVTMIVLYTYYSFAITRWRIRFRRQMNDSDADANTKAVDSLLNYETVKYFNAERHETRRFDASISRYADASVKSMMSLALLNVGQQVIIALGLAVIMILSAVGIKNGTLKLGDFVVATAYLIQLQRPLNLMGTLYREISQALADMEAMFGLLRKPQEIADKLDATPLLVSKGEIRFENVVFAYEPDRVILKGLSFRVPAGKTVAIVGPSGAGKSTVSRILYRFYDIQSGKVSIDSQDIRDVTQASLRAAIGIVPQDTVLFNDTILYNIAYGRIGAGVPEIAEAARLAQIDTFIRELPQGYETMVGERGLKLSGGEKQRVAIARTLLKDPPILLLDEATSALDTHTEREIQSALKAVARNRTTLVIAHRLSTVVDADEILVLDHGEIIERGRHAELVARGGAYAAMWNKQKEAAEVRERLEAAAGDPDVGPDIARVAASAAE